MTTTHTLQVGVDCSTEAQVLISPRHEVALPMALPILVECGMQVTLTFELQEGDSSVGILEGFTLTKVGPCWRGMLARPVWEAIQDAFAQEVMDDFCDYMAHGKAEARGEL